MTPSLSAEPSYRSPWHWGYWRSRAAAAAGRRQRRVVFGGHPHDVVDRVVLRRHDRGDRIHRLRPERHGVPRLLLEALEDGLLLDLVPGTAVAQDVQHLVLRGCGACNEPQHRGTQNCCRQFHLPASPCPYFCLTARSARDAADISSCGAILHRPTIAARTFRPHYGTESPSDPSGPGQNRESPRWTRIDDGDIPTCRRKTRPKCDESEKPHSWAMAAIVHSE